MFYIVEIGVHTLNVKTDFITKPSFWQAQKQNV